MQITTNYNNFNNKMLSFYFDFAHSARSALERFKKYLSALFSSCQVTRYLYTHATINYFDN